MKIGVIVNDAGQAANCNGGNCELSVKTFDMPIDVWAFILNSRKNSYANIGLVIVDEGKERELAAKQERGFE